MYAAIAESLASTGTAVEVVPKGLVPFGLNNSTQVVGEIRDGVLEGLARCRAHILADLTIELRAAAVSNGAIELDNRTFVAKVRELRAKRKAAP